MSSGPEPIERQAFETRVLMAEHPPVWRHPNKELVYGIACPAGSTPRGEIRYSRWPMMKLPDTLDPAAFQARVEGREDVYDYAPVLGTGQGVEWHVNFADPELFVAYGSALLAQDEMQVAEHPALGALKEALDADGGAALTVEDDRPTPVLVMGVERRCRIATEANAAEGRPQGLYGNAFARAPAATVRRATNAIDPPTITNLIAMAAHPPAHGRYTGRQIAYTLATAFTGFRAALLESTRDGGARATVVVHTGFWGCGAFGGHRVLMAALQVLAAGMAGIDRLVFHTHYPAGSKALATAERLVRTDLGGNAPMATRQLIERIVALGFEWGVSDGN